MKDIICDGRIKTLSDIQTLDLPFTFLRKFLENVPPLQNKEFRQERGRQGIQHKKEVKEIVKRMEKVSP